jgi:nucleoid DNA-binding protein
MHSFNPLDAQILLGLYGAHQADGFSCLDIIAACDAVNNSIPTSEEFTEAFNKLLYVSAIVIDGEQVALANFGKELINKAKTNAGAKAQLGELVTLVNRELSTYKLKSMCNRQVWTREQYQRAIDLHHSHIKP